MQISKLLLYTGIWTAILPYLGIPSFIKNILFVITGFVLIYLSILLRNVKKNNNLKKAFENFSENFNLANKN